MFIDNYFLCLKETFQSLGEKKEESTEHHDMETSVETDSRKSEDMSQMTKEVASHGAQEHGDGGVIKGSSHGVLGAIGETIVEIAQTTKDLVIGEDFTRQQKRDQSNES